jgi:hypothetical protein
VIAQVAAGAEGRLTDGANMISDTAAKKITIININLIILHSITTVRIKV